MEQFDPKHLNTKLEAVEIVAITFPVTGENSEQYKTTTKYNTPNLVKKKSIVQQWKMNYLSPKVMKNVLILLFNCVKLPL